MVQEEVHGAVQFRDTLSEEDDHRITQQGGQVDQKHHPEQGCLQGSEVSES